MDPSLGPPARLSRRWLLGVLALLWAAAASGAEPLWVERDQNGAPQVHLYFFWSAKCPHCREARPFIEALGQAHPWLLLHDYELTADPAHGDRYRAMAESLGEEVRYVPAFFVCGRMLAGYDGPEGLGAELRALAEACRAQAGSGSAPAGVSEPLTLPPLGAVDPQALGLPLFTLVVAGLDAFNPCAFFVLLFLLSLMVHARSRARMLLVGGTFVLISGLVYFLFMAAWLNLFLVMGATPWVTLGAGVLALVIGVLNVKDFLAFHRGPTLSIPEGAKPGLFRRMRVLVGSDRLGTLLLGTLVLAIAANSYELLCTAGFPMVYTRALTLNGLSLSQYYAYLALYNLIYVLPLRLIVGVFTHTLGARKLTEGQGRRLKPEFLGVTVGRRSATVRFPGRRAAAPHPPADPKPLLKSLNVNEFLEELIRLSLPWRHARNVSLFASLSSEIPSILGDPTHLQTLFLNLITNALDAMPRGGHLSISTQIPSPPALSGENGKWVKISIADTGIGITEESKKRIFDPFFTTKKIGEGTGLGLAICEKIIKEHAGRLEVESMVAKGSTFSIFIPALGREEIL